MLPYISAIRRFSVSMRRTSNFVEEMQRSYIPTSTFQRTLLSCGSALLSLLDPHRGDMIACLGEVTGQTAIKYMREKMLETSEGAEILREMPRINSSTVSFEVLSQMPVNTIGRIYADFMRDNNITADSRLLVQFIGDPELAYVMQRYREVHDLVHATLFMKTTMLGEVTVKWVEGIQTKLPMCINGGIWGAGRLKPKHRKLYLKYYLPWAIKTGNTAKFMQDRWYKTLATQWTLSGNINTFPRDMQYTSDLADFNEIWHTGIYYEKRWDQDIDDFHKEMNIVRLA